MFARSIQILMFHYYCCCCEAGHQGDPRFERRPVMRLELPPVGVCWLARAVSFYILFYNFRLVTIN